MPSVFDASLVAQLPERCVGVKEAVKKLVNLGNPFLSSILIQNLPKPPKKCPICWASHMFSIWEYRYSYGICFGTVYALQNSTPNISTPDILGFFLSTPEGLKSAIFYVVDHDYIYMCVYTNSQFALTYEKTRDNSYPQRFSSFAFLLMNNMRQQFHNDNDTNHESEFEVSINNHCQQVRNLFRSGLKRVL